MPRSKPFTPWSLASALLLLLVATTTWWDALADPDLWWLLWAGESMKDGVGLPRQNLLSFTAPAHPWVCHEPLVAWLYGQVGLQGVSLTRIVCHSITVLLILRMASATASGWAAVLALFWLSPLVTPAFTERALAWGNLCLCVLLVSMSRPGRAGQVLRIGTLVIWANVHGSFVVGLLVLFVYRPKEGLFAALASLANPHGIRLHELIVSYGLGFGPQGLVHQFVEEWRPLFPSTPGNIMRLACLLVGAWASLRRGQKRASILCILMTLLALKHQRYCAPAGLVMLPYVLQALTPRLPMRPLGTPAWLLAPMLVLGGLAAPRAKADPDRFPEAVLEGIPPGARTWSDFTLGGWLGHAGHRVYWDSRNDCYPKGIIEDGVRIAYQLDGWEQLLDKWRIDHVLTAEQALTQALLSMGWIPVVEAEHVVLLARSAESG